MLILRKHYSENISSNTYYPAQVMTNTLNDTIGYTEGALDIVDQSRIGNVPPVKKKTRMVKNMISGLKGIMPKKKKKLKNKKDYVHSS